MENTSSSSSSASAASSATALTSTGRRRFRPSIVQWFTILALAPTSSSAREVSRDSYGRKDRLLPDLPVDKLDGTEYRKQDNGFPGLVFYEDKSIGNLGLELSSNYQDETESRYDGTNSVRWQWRHKTSGYSSSGDYSCKSSKSAKSSKSTRSPTSSSQPSTSSSPTNAPSQSSSPTGSSSSKSTKKSKAKSSLCAPTQSPYPTISNEPTVSDAPSASPSFSRMPTISDAPSLSSEPSLSPSLSFMPSESSAPSRMTTTGNSDTSTDSTTTSALTNGTGNSNTSTDSTTTSALTNGTGNSNTSTDSTTTSADPVSPGDNGGANEEDCENIKSKNWKDNESFFSGLDDNGDPKRTDEDAQVDLAFDISFPVSYDSADFTTEEVRALLDNGLSVVIALWVAGCEQQARDLFDSQAQRQLQSDQLEYSEMSPYSAGAECTPEGNDSCNIFDSVIIFLFEDGSDIDEDDETVLVDRIRQAFELFAPDFSERNGLYVNSGALTIKSDDNFNQIVEDENFVPDGSIAAGTVVGIVAAALAFILLLILLIRRRQEDGDEPSHFKLDDDADEDNEATFIREFQTDPSSEGSSPYKTRSAHVVGEADSVMSGWTGFTKHGHAVEIDDDANNTGKLGHAHGDVHMCSSATCEVCELRRRNGVQFQPTGTPPRAHLPTDASREYISEDTVEL